jgi:outer membrane protein assembly factor BamB
VVAPVDFEAILELNRSTTGALGGSCTARPSPISGITEMIMSIRTMACAAAILTLLLAFGASRDASAQFGGLVAATFQRGDVIVSLEPGPVQWHGPDGSLKRILLGTEVGTGEGVAFDAAGNLYVTRWCMDAGCSSANTVETFTNMGLPAGRFGTDYDCAPHAILFDALGAAYVGLAGCTGAIVKVTAGQPQASFPVAPDNQGAFWIDLAPDGCTMFYTSWGPNVKRYDVCARGQLANFNRMPLPGGATQDLRVLPDGGVLVSSGEVIARLDAAGTMVQTYHIPGEPSLWSGLELVGDGTFWAGNYETSNVYRFDLATGAVRARFNTGSPARTVVGIRVSR